MRNGKVGCVNEQSDNKCDENVDSVVTSGYEDTKGVKRHEGNGGRERDPVVFEIQKGGEEEARKVATKDFIVASAFNSEREGIINLTIFIFRENGDEIK